MKIECEKCQSNNVILYQGILRCVESECLHETKPCYRCNHEVFKVEPGQTVPICDKHYNEENDTIRKCEKRN